MDVVVCKVVEALVVPLVGDIDEVVTPPEPNDRLSVGVGVNVDVL
jgi:hypothetical protein